MRKILELNWFLESCYKAHVGFYPCLIEVDFGGYLICSCFFSVATPKQIRELMQVEGLTNDEVKSHLQV